MTSISTSAGNNIGSVGVIRKEMKTDAKYLPLGTKVKVNATFEKKKTYAPYEDLDEKYFGRHTHTEWSSVPRASKPGIIVGLRRVQDGEVVYVNEAYYNEPDYSYDHFKVTKSHIVYLVSLNRWHEPVKVLPKDLEIINENL